MKVKTEVDKDCYECPHYHYIGGRISTDAYSDYPAEADCGYDWECPMLEDECGKDCEYCEASCSERGLWIVSE
jgi:hypothetical protein